MYCLRRAENVGVGDMLGIGILTRAVFVAYNCHVRSWHVAAGIPDSLGGLSKLETLDLSNNKLTCECVGVG